MPTGVTNKMDVILVCRMSSTRLPGKTLMPFGSHSLLEHILKRLQLGGIERSKIVVCCSDSREDDPIEYKVKEIGIGLYRGSQDNVSQRVIDAATSFGYSNFLLVLGDNPWIDPEQILAIKCDKFKESTDRYVVTATPELINNTPERFGPIGTRLQKIPLKLLVQLYKKYRSPDTEEHMSLLFKNLDPQEMFVLTPDSELDYEFIRQLNVSINTKVDYEIALDVLHQIGPDANLNQVLDGYRVILCSKSY